MSDASEQRCPKCGGPIPSEAPQGLCPRCLLAGVSIPTDAGKEMAAALPSREELAAAFPHLEILELIGQGGMGFVFRARQPKLDRFVALKILSQSHAADETFAERFTREGRVLARLNHPAIVTVHDFGQANGFFYLLMEFVDGVNLRQAMQAGRFTPDQALTIVPKICEALQYAHNEGILHRDIKPENILLDTRGRVKIADFGIAKLVADVRPEGNLTVSGSTLGTPHYMAPEQIERPATVDHRADIYSLGVVFYEMLTGELPLGRFAPPSEKSAADPRLDDVVFRTLEKEPARRPQTAGDVKTQVETIAADPRGTAVPPVISESSSWAKWIGIVLLVLSIPLTTFGALVFYWVLQDRSWNPSRNEAFVSIVSWVLPLALLTAGVLCIRVSRPRRRVTRGGGGILAAKIAVCVVLGSIVTVFGLYYFAGVRGARQAAIRRMAAEQEMQEKAAVAEAVASRLPTKTIQLTGATNQIRGGAREVRFVAVKTESLLRPGEIIAAKIRHPDWRYEESQTSTFVNRRAEEINTSAWFSWHFPDAFGVDAMEEALAQLQRDWTEHAVTLTNGRPLLVFSVTNSVGGVLHGYLQFTQQTPASDGSRPQATVRVRSYDAASFLLFYNAHVPDGYALQATTGRPWPSAGAAHTSRTTPLDERNCSWVPDRDLSAEERAQAEAQLKALSTFNVFLGEPFRVLSLTNQQGEVFEGFLELFGPTSMESTAIPRIAAAAAQRAEPDRVIPTTNDMHALAVRISNGDQPAFEELHRLSRELYRGLDRAKEPGRVLTNLYLMRAAFGELGQQAARGNLQAFTALQDALAFPHMKGHVTHALGTAAAAGHEQSLDMLINHGDWNILLSSAVFALRAPADNNNERAIQFLTEVLADKNHRALWHGASEGLRVAASKGHVQAKEALKQYQLANTNTVLNAR